MKNIIRLALPFVAMIILVVSCPTTDPNVKAPQEEYEQAKKMRTRIVTLKFTTYAPEEWEAGEADFAVGEENYEKDNAKSKVSLDSAIANYRIVIRKAIEARSKTEEENINLWKKKSDDIKASVSVPDDYAAAEEKLKAAQAAAAQEDWETAETLYAEAEELFQQIFQTVKAKKDKAQNTYDETNTILEGLKGSQGGSDSGTVNP